MLRKSLLALLLVAVAVSFMPAQQAQAKDAAAQLLGTWQITHRPLDSAGKPCPFLPESIEFIKGQNLIMSNIPDRSLPYKTELTAAEREGIEARSDGYKGKNLLLVKPVPQMDWLSTPMVYIYSVTKSELTLTADGWEPSTFKRIK